MQNAVWLVFGIGSALTILVVSTLFVNANAPERRDLIKVAVIGLGGACIMAVAVAFALAEH